MAYCLRRKDATVEKAIRRIAREQIDKAIGSIEGKDDLAGAVHDVRVRCKKLRSLIRLVQPDFGGFSKENTALRDIARLLSGLRDARVMQDTYDRLVRHNDAQVDRRVLGQIRRHFTLEGKAELARVNVTKLLEESRRELLDARDRASRWKLAEDGWDAMAGGLSRTYALARKAADNAREQPGVASYHELRKRVKYHWFHTILLKRIWSEEMGYHAAQAMQLSEILGEFHDLAVFKDRITDELENFRANDAVEMALVLTHRRRAMLEEKIWPLATHLLAEPPEALFDHWHALWAFWRKK